MEISKELASYIADYINEELDYSQPIDQQTIIDAVDAYNSGAR